jgi:hypothetical protein
LLLASNSIHAFPVNIPSCGGQVRFSTICSTKLYGKKVGDDVSHKSAAFDIGTLVEFEEKSREHIGKITKADHKGSGGGSTCYHVVDSNGKMFEIPDKAHSASTIEKYMAWKILRTDAVAHVFFREVKDHGRVVSFKAKARKAVDSARQAFCLDHHDDSDLCLVV